MAGFFSNIEEETLQNDNFRKVLFTGTHMQLVVMCLKAGEDIGNEVHNTVDQFFRFESGEGKVVIGDSEYLVKDGDVIVVPAGNYHNIINTSKTKELKLYTIYSPANHPAGTIHKTRAEAVAAEEAHKD